MLTWSACNSATTWGADQTLIQFDSLRQSLVAGYDLDGFSGTKPGAASDKVTRQAFRERYNVGFNYDIYSPRLLQGTVALGLEGEQYVDRSTHRSGESSGNKLSYGINGNMFKAKPFPIGFSLDSSTYRVNPAYSRSYDVDSEQYNANFRLKNDKLPLRLSFRKSVKESSGLAQDSRDTTDAWTATVERLASTNNTAVSFNVSDATTTPLSADREEISSSAVAASATNRWRFSKNPQLARDCLSTFSYSKNGGPSQSSVTDWKESLVWAFGKALKAQVDGELNIARQGDLTRQERQVSTALEQRIANSITTKIFSDLRQTVLDTGNESEVACGASIDYRSRISDQVELAAGYSYNYGVIDSSFGDDTVFFNDERLNVLPLETDHYLGRNDIVASSIVIWNLDRTKIYTGADYTAVADGRRTRIRIEPGSSIAIGDQVLIEYRVQVNPNVKRNSVTRAAAISLGLWQRYRISVSWSDSMQKRLSGQADNVPLPRSENGSVFFERSSPSNTLGLSWAWLDSDSSVYRKYEGYWKFRHEFDSNNLEMNVRDSHTVFSDAGAGNSKSLGGTNNVFQADASYRRTLSERANFSLNGSYKKASGRSMDQELYSTWLQGRLRVLRMETNLNLRLDWRMYQAYSQRDYSLRFVVKRNF